MKKLLTKLLFFYSAIASVFIAISLALSSKNLPPIVFALFFLPVAAYFIIELFKQFRSGSDTGITLKKGNVITLSVLFLVLLGVGLKNIYTGSATPSPQPVPSSSPLIFKVVPTSSPESTASAKEVKR